MLMECLIAPVEGNPGLFGREGMKTGKWKAETAQAIRSY